MFASRPTGEAARHEGVSAKTGKCGQKMLVRSKKNPRVRRWVCMGTRGKSFDVDKHARMLLTELEDRGKTHITKRRAEHQSIQGMHREGWVKLKANPRHYNYEYEVSITDKGRKALTERRAEEDRAEAARQHSMFKGRLVVSPSILQRVLWGMAKAEEQLGLFGPRKVDVKQHARKKPKGGVTIVKQHQRDVDAEYKGRILRLLDSLRESVTELLERMTSGEEIINALGQPDGGQEAIEMLRYRGAELRGITMGPGSRAIKKEIDAQLARLDYQPDPVTTAPEMASGADMTRPAGEDSIKRFEILAPNWSKFRDHFTKLRDRALKLGVEMPVFELVGEGEKEVTRLIHDPWGASAGLSDPFGGSDGWREVSETHKYYEVEITGPTVKVGGWTAVAVVESLGKDAEGEPVSKVAALGGAENLPASLWSTGMHCDHCGLTRNRKKCWALQSDSGKWMQVGSSCLADFTGRSPTEIARISEFLETHFMRDLAEDEEQWGRTYGPGGRPAGTWDILDVLAVTAWVVEQDGEYIGRGRAEVDRLTPTAEAVADLLFKPPLPEELKADRNVYRAHAETVLAWMRSLDSEVYNDDYHRNLRAATRVEHIGDKEIGLVASAIAGYRRHLADIDRAKLKAQQFAIGYGQHHVGQPGDKIGRKLSKKDKAAGATFHPSPLVVVERIATGESHYGPWSMVIATDAAGNVYKIPFSGGRTNWNLGDDVFEPFTRGETFSLVGTIKKHGSWIDHDGDEIKQTELTRSVLTRTLTARERPIFEAGQAAELADWPEDQNPRMRAASGERAGWRAVRSAHENGELPMELPMEKGDRLPGGLADDKTPDDFDPDALAEGTRVEREHVNDPALAREIAMDHLTEDPAYYRKLRRIEKGTRLRSLGVVKLHKGASDAPEYRKSDNGTYCGDCHWSHGGNCELYDFRYMEGYTCAAWQPTGDQSPDLPARGNGHGGTVITDTMDKGNYGQVLATVGGAAAAASKKKSQAAVRKTMPGSSGGYAHEHRVTGGGDKPKPDNSAQGRYEREKQAEKQVRQSGGFGVRGGAGSRGGKVVGYTAKGNPIYESSKNAGEANAHDSVHGQAERIKNETRNTQGFLGTGSDHHKGRHQGAKMAQDAVKRSGGDMDKLHSHLDDAVTHAHKQIGRGKNRAHWEGAIRALHNTAKHLPETHRLSKAEVQQRVHQLSKGCGCNDMRKCDGGDDCPGCKSGGYAGGPAEQQGRNQARMVVLQKCRPMHKGVMPEGARMIMEVDDELDDSPATTSWQEAGYTMTYRQGKGIGVLTASGGGLPLPFHQVVGNANAARMQARTLAQQLDAGTVPDQGVFRPLKVKRARYRKSQGGVRL
jgi:hypothetical protein